MDQTRFLQRVRMNQFKKVYDRWKQKKLTQEEAAEQLGTFYFLSSKNFMYIADLSFLGRGLLVCIMVSSFFYQAAITSVVFLKFLSNSSPFSSSLHATKRRRSPTERRAL